MENREIKFEYGFKSVNRIVKKVYFLHEIPDIKQKCDVWDNLPIAYVRQFTGLKDKNGKEIYEGDVLKCFQFKYKIVFERGSFVCYHIGENQGIGKWGNLSRLYDADFADFRGVATVIGNIYETPDELTK